MKKLIFIGVYGMLILGGAAGGTWYLRQRDLDAQAAKEAKHVDVTSLGEAVDVTQPLPPKESQDLPVAVRPGEMSVEEIVRYGLGLKAREGAIREREEALRRTETKYRLVLADIEGEQKEIEGLFAQARDQRVATEELLKQANEQKMASQKLLQEASDQKKESEKLKNEAEQKKTESELMMKQMENMTKTADQPATAKTAGKQEMEIDREANLKELVGVMEGMSPEGASSIIREFSNDGRMEMAVEILSKVEDRRAAAIIDALNDEKLASELISKFAELKRPVKN